MDKHPCVYMLASSKNGTLYIGVTSNLPQRLAQHREGQVEGFSKRHGVTRLVWYEPHESMESAIIREKRLKKWNREWKAREIARRNPQWKDIYDELNR
jgi:putative endonuclease